MRIIWLVTSILGLVVWVIGIVYTEWSFASLGATLWIGSLIMEKLGGRDDEKENRP